MTWKKIGKLYLYSIVATIIFSLFSLSVEVFLKIQTREVATIFISFMIVFIPFSFIVILLMKFFVFLSRTMYSNKLKSSKHNDLSYSKNYPPIENRTLFYIAHISKAIYITATIFYFPFSIIFTGTGLYGCNGKHLCSLFYFIIIFIIPFVLLIIGIIYTNYIIKGTTSKIYILFAFFPIVILIIFMLIYIIGAMFLSS